MSMRLTSQAIKLMHLNQAFVENVLFQTAY